MDGAKSNTLCLECDDYGGANLQLTAPFRVMFSLPIIASVGGHLQSLIFL